MLSGTRIDLSYCWREIDSARNPCTTSTSAGISSFGSEPKALLQHPRCPGEIDWESLSRYLALEYVPTPHAIYSRMRKLPGGHTLRWRHGQSTVEKYWDLTFPENEPSGREDDYIEQFRVHFREAVRRRLVSDVPLGAFLSGGVDSSSVVAMMSETIAAGSAKTFTIGFDDRSFDESHYARRVAQHFGTEHYEEVFTPRALLELLPAAVEQLDEPFADASYLPTHLLSRFTRDHVTVALGGDGGDELLAGYPTFSADRVASLYRVPRLLHDRLVLPLADRLPASTRNFSLDFKVKRFVRGASLGADIRHPMWLGAFAPAEQQALLNREPGETFTEWRAAYAAAPTSRPLERLIYAYAKTYLQDDILVKIDRASMASSLEVRAPFLDVDLVTFLGRVPARLKLKRLDTKHLLKRAMADVLPPGIAERPKKGFGIPIAEWFKNELREPLQEELSEARLKAQGIFEHAEVQRLLSDHLSGRRDHRKQLWTLFVFQLWHRRWAARPASSDMSSVAAT